MKPFRTVRQQFQRNRAFALDKKICGVTLTHTIEEKLPNQWFISFWPIHIHVGQDRYISFGDMNETLMFGPADNSNRLSMFFDFFEDQAKAHFRAIARAYTGDLIYTHVYVKHDVPMTYAQLSLEGSLAVSNVLE